MKSLYQLALEQMEICDIDHHESDLYLKKNAISDHLLEHYEYKESILLFIDQIDRQYWYEIPFAYDPYWKKTFQSTKEEFECHYM